MEIRSSFYNLPRLDTAARWREEAPAGFVYSMQAWQLITHPSSHSGYAKLSGERSARSLERCGHFRQSEEVAAAWERTQAVAEALGAGLIVFETPSSFYPTADHLRDMYRFFRGTRRGGLIFIWEPRGESWREKLVSKVCGDLGLIASGGALSGAEAPSPAWKTRCLRLHGGHEGTRFSHGHRFSDGELRDILERCGAGAAYVFFANADMWRDALRFQALVEPPILPPRKTGFFER